jgi:hypothetical protein
MVDFKIMGMYCTEHLSALCCIEQTKVISFIHRGLKRFQSWKGFHPSPVKRALERRGEQRMHNYIRDVVDVD